MKLTPQEKKVYDFIKANRGATTSDIQQALKIECPSARITGMRRKGVKIISIGQKHYPGSRPFERYAIEEEVKPRIIYEEKMTVDGIVRVPKLIS